MDNARKAALPPRPKDLGFRAEEIVKLPSSIVREIAALPDGKPVSFAVHTDGKEAWKIEVNKHLKEGKEAELCDLANLLVDNGEKKDNAAR